MIVITSASATNMDCSVDPARKCSGDSCMAWQVYFKAPHHDPATAPSNTTFTRTDKGYCGMVANPNFRTESIK